MQWIYNNGDRIIQHFTNKKAVRKFRQCRDQYASFFAEFPLSPSCWSDVVEDSTVNPLVAFTNLL